MPQTRDLYMLDSLSDRDRLYLMFDLLHDSFVTTIERARELAGAGAGWRLLDVACGEALHAAELAEHHPQAQFVAFDRDEEAAATAQKAFRQLHNLAIFAHDIMQPLPAERVPEGGFDVAQVRFALTHFSDPIGGLGHIKQVLKPGGVIYLVDPRSDVFGLDHPSINFLSEACVRAWSRFGTKAAGDRQVSLLEQAGFTVLDSRIDEHEVGGPGSPAYPMLRLMVETLRSMRKALVEVTAIMDGPTFDSHIDNILTTTPSDARGRARFQITFARA